MTLCDNLKLERDQLTQTNENAHWPLELAQAQEKQMEVCEVCGAFLIVGDAQQRIEDHLTGKQHLGLVVNLISISLYVFYYNFNRHNN